MPRKKSPVTLPGIDPGPFRLVAQRNNNNNGDDDDNNNIQ
jgi:hypothetical protein